jgi:hypothetical protein
MFVTEGTTPMSALAGDPIAAAAGVCQAAASAASLPGMIWTAWISTTTSNAIDRLAGARGWIRPDGRPFADLPSSLAAGEVFYPPRVTEKGNLVDSSDPILTGTGEDGALASRNCANWASTSGSAEAGEPAGGSGGWTDSPYRLGLCGNPLRFYCFGLDYSMPVSPPRAEGRGAFLSRTPFAPGPNGRAAADQICQTEADANSGLVPAGTYLALLALSTEAAAARFDVSKAPWVRPDGVPLVARARDLFDTSSMPDTLMLAALTATADGSYFSRAHVWTGAPKTDAPGDLASTCGDWLSTVGQTGASGESSLALAATIPGFFGYNATRVPCAETLPVYCLQQ